MNFELLTQLIVNGLIVGLLLRGDWDVLCTGLQIH